MLNPLAEMDKLVMVLLVCSCALPFVLIGVGIIEIVYLDTYTIADWSCSITTLGAHISTHSGINSTCTNEIQELKH